MYKKTFIFIVISLCGLSFFSFLNKPIKQNSNNFVVGTSADYPPYAFIDTKTNKLVGFDIDIAQEIGNRLEKKTIIKDMPFTSLIFDLFSGQIDVVAAGISPNDRRSHKVLFSKSYLSNDPIVLVTKKETAPIKKIADVYGKPVAVNTGYTSDLFLSQIPEMNLVKLRSPAEAFMALQTSSVYAFATAQSSLTMFMSEKNKNNVQIFIIPKTAEEYALAFSKKNRSLQQSANKAIAAMEQDGTLKKIKEKWKVI